MPKQQIVEDWFKAYDISMAEVVRVIRDVVFATALRIGECIKWQAPTITYKGNLASFFPRSKKHASYVSGWC